VAGISYNLVTTFLAHTIVDYPHVLSNSCLPGFVHYEVLVCNGNVVTVEGGIMHEPKASSLSARHSYYIA